MRWLIMGTLAYFAYGSLGVAAEDWRDYRQLFADSKMALGMAAACVAGIVGLATGWGM